VFYLEDDLYCQRGDKITGSFAMKPNGRNKRDMDIAISSEHHTADGSVFKQKMCYNMH
jgi:hypothetical protein